MERVYKDFVLLVDGMKYGIGFYCNAVRRLGEGCTLVVL